MQGFVQIETCQVEEVEFEFAIIARRSRERAGLRYERRGVDEEGHAANFVENEMILIFRDLDGKQHHTSFIQTRGSSKLPDILGKGIIERTSHPLPPFLYSVPFFWSQVPTTLKPVPNIDGNDQENEGALLAHFAKQQQQYQNIIAVNLVEQTGREAIIGQRFKQLMEKVSLPNVKYLDFDFHAQTKGMHYEKLNGLLNLLDNLGLSRHFKYFWSSDTEIICRQGGVVRTNCM